MDQKHPSENAPLDAFSHLEKRLFESREGLRRRLENLGDTIDSAKESVENIENIVRFCDQVMTTLITHRPYQECKKQNSPATFLEENIAVPEFAHVRAEVLLAFARPSFHIFVEHSFAVAACAEELYLASDADKTFLRPFCFGALLHDVGMAALQDPEQSKFSQLEKNVGHTLLGDLLLSRSVLRSHEIGAEIAKSHHERWNGTGFPEKLTGTQIPLTGRIVAICDTLDILMSRLEAPGAQDFHRVKDAIWRSRGTSFDPDLTASLCDRFETYVEIRDHARILAREALDAHLPFRKASV